jgi:WD40 repeat protein
MFSPDGKTVIITHWSDVVIVDVATGKELQKFEFDKKNVITFAAFSPDGKTVIIACSSHEVMIADAATGKVVKTFTISIESIESEDIEKLQELFDKTSDNSFKLNDDLDLEGHEILVLSRPLGVLKVDFALFSPDGKTVITGDGAGVVRIWDVETGKELKKFDGGYCTEDSISFSPDSKTVVIAVDEEVYICNLNMIRQHLEQKE